MDLIGDPMDLLSEYDDDLLELFPLISERAAVSPESDDNFQFNNVALQQGHQPSEEEGQETIAVKKECLSTRDAPLSPVSEEHEFPGDLPRLSSEECRLNRLNRRKIMRERKAKTAASTLLSAGGAASSLSAKSSISASPHLGPQAAGRMIGLVPSQIITDSSSSTNSADNTPPSRGSARSSSSSMDATASIAEALNNMPELPEGSTKEEKKQRRKIRNRMAAQLHRERKIMAMENLKREVSEKNDECVKLRQALDALKPMVAESVFQSVMKASGLHGGDMEASPGAERLSENSDDDSSSSSRGVTSEESSLSPSPVPLTVPLTPTKRVKRTADGIPKVAKVAMLGVMGFCAMIGVMQGSPSTFFDPTAGSVSHSAHQLQVLQQQHLEHRRLLAEETSIDESLDYRISPMENYPVLWQVEDGKPWSYERSYSLFTSPKFFEEPELSRGPAARGNTNLRGAPSTALVQKHPNQVSRSSSFIYAPTARAHLDSSLFVASPAAMRRAQGDEKKAMVLANTDAGGRNRQHFTQQSYVTPLNPNLVILMPTKSIMQHSGSSAFMNDPLDEEDIEDDATEGEDTSWTELTCRVTKIKQVFDVDFRQH